MLRVREKKRKKKKEENPYTYPRSTLTTLYSPNLKYAASDLISPFLTPLLQSDFDLT